MQDILDLEALESGKFPLRAEVVDVRETVRGIARWVRTVFPRTRSVTSLFWVGGLWLRRFFSLQRARGRQRSSLQLEAMVSSHAPAPAS